MEICQSSSPLSPCAMAEHTADAHCALPAIPAWLEVGEQGQGIRTCPCGAAPHTWEGPVPLGGHQEAQAVQQLLGLAVGTVSARSVCHEHVALQGGMAMPGYPRGSLRLHGEPVGL